MDMFVHTIDLADSNLFYEVSIASRQLTDNHFSQSVSGFDLVVALITVLSFINSPALIINAYSLFAVKDYVAHQSKGVNLTQSRLELNNLLQERQAKLGIIDKKDSSGIAIGTTVIIKIKEELQ